MKKYLRLIGIFLFIIILLKIDPGEMVDSLSGTNWSGIIIVILMNLVIMLLRSWRWIKLLEIQNYSLGLPEAFWSYMRSFYLGSVTPGRVGELFRAHYLMKYVKTDSAVAVSSVAFDRLLDMYFMLILGIVGLLFSDIWVAYLWVKAVFIFLMILIPAFVLFPSLTLAIAGLLPDWWQIRTKSAAWLESFFAGIKMFLTPKALLAVSLTVLIYIMFFFQCLLLAYFMNLSIDFFYLTFCVVIFSIFSILPISFSNMGTREFVLIFMFGYIGISQAEAVSYSLLFFFTINVFLATIGWLIFVFYTDKDQKELSKPQLLNSNE